MHQASSPDYRKPCTLCHKPRDVLVRCQIDETGAWHFLCPGLCWTRASGGVIDGDKSDEHKWYRYGGMWKNKHEAVSAKKPKKAGKHPEPWRERTGAAHEAEEPNAAVTLATGALEENAGDGADEGTDLKMWSGADEMYEKDKRIAWKRKTWVCRKGHTSNDKRAPDTARSFWKLET